MKLSDKNVWHSGFILNLRGAHVSQKMNTWWPRLFYHRDMRYIAIAIAGIYRLFMYMNLVAAVKRFIQ